MGPGRFNEHTNQHVIAAWDGAPEMHQPELLPSGEFDVAALADSLADPAIAAGIPQVEPARQEGRRVPRGPVWHCSLRNSVEDRELTDEEWAEVVADLMERTGIAPAEDLGSCRWVAIRHADDHVHIAAMLVRQDNGRKVHPPNDFLRAREVCRDAEERLGLTGTAAIDRTTAEPATRAEMEKAARRGEVETSRDWLRRAARVAAVQAQDPEDFFRRLADLGASVRPKELPPGQLVGYAVAAPGDETSEGMPVWFSGRSLARDLALPKLLARWASATPQESIPPAPGERSQIGRTERETAVAEAVAAVEQATTAVASGERAVVASVAHAAGDMLSAVCTVTERGRGVAPVPWAAADVFDRAARTPGQGQPNRWEPVASQLRSAAWRLVAVRAVTGKTGDSGVGQLVLALAALAAEIAAFREQQHCVAQAGAARRSAQLLRQPRSARPGGAAGTHPPRASRGPERRAGAEPVAVRGQVAGHGTGAADRNTPKGRQR